jgi:hypothetical protein
MEVYKIVNGKTLFDINGDKVIENYKRYMPDFSMQETWIAIFFIVIGAGLVLLIDKFGSERKEYSNE